MPVLQVVEVAELDKGGQGQKHRQDSSDASLRKEGRKEGPKATVTSCG